VSLQNAVNVIDDYMEPIDLVQHAADDDVRDDVSQPQYAEVMSTRRSERRRQPVPRRPYEDVAQYAIIDHRIPTQTFLVVDDHLPSV